MNAARDLAASAARGASAIAIQLDDVELSYRSLDTASARVAALLRKRAIEPGERVAAMLPNVPELAVVAYGALRAGCVVCPLSIELDEQSLGDQLQALDAKLLFAWHAVAEVAEAAGRDSVFVSPREFAQLLSTVEPARDVVERGEEDPALVVGGREWTHGELAARPVEMTADDVVLALSQLGSAPAVLAAAVAAGARIVLMSSFDERRARELIAREGVTVVEGPPAALGALREDGATVRAWVGDVPGAPADRVPSDGDGLELEDVSVHFGGLTALDDVSLAVERGRVVGVIGPNGAGKTTLFNVICGFLRADTGALRWDGRSLAGVRPHRLARLGIARTLQGVGLFRNLTALENVMVAADHLHRPLFATALLGLPRSDRAERRLRAVATEALAAVDASDAAHQNAGSMPYPLQKRVALARALVARPRLLLLDEPAGGLGADDVSALGDVIRGLGGSMTVLVVEHRMDLVMSVCDEVVVLDSGRLIAQGTPSDVQRDPAVLEAYLGAESEAAHA